MGGGQEYNVRLDFVWNHLDKLRWRGLGFDLLLLHQRLDLNYTAGIAEVGAHLEELVGFVSNAILDAALVRDTQSKKALIDWLKPVERRFESIRSCCYFSLFSE